VRLRWWRRGHHAALLVTFGSGLGGAAPRRFAWHEAVRAAFLVGVACNVAAAVAWGSRAVRRGLVSRGLCRGVAALRGPLTRAGVALGECGRILVRVAPGLNRRWLLPVEEGGPGLAPEVKARPFHPLSTTRAGRCGAGLASVEALAGRGGGGVAIRSSPGRGAAVEVEYPGIGDGTAGP